MAFNRFFDILDSIVEYNKNINNINNMNNKEEKILEYTKDIIDIMKKNVVYRINNGGNIYFKIDRTLLDDVSEKIVSNVCRKIMSDIEIIYNDDRNNHNTKMKLLYFFLDKLSSFTENPIFE